MNNTIILDIRNNQFPQITVPKGSLVVWRNLDPQPHSVEMLSGGPFYFNAGPLLPGEVSSPVHFHQEGLFDYICRFHADMSGQIGVGAVSIPAPAPPHPGGGGHHGDHSGHDHGGHGPHHIKHFHGFVTGGRSAKSLFLSHTPVLADERHHFQIILQASLPQPSHAAAYEAMRNSVYKDGKVQLFHDHLALTDIRDGLATVLPEASFEYYPDDPNGILGGTPVPGLEEKIPVQIDKIIHFHTFDKDADYPDALNYLLYGNEEDVFIDHLINTAPSFHSIAKLKECPKGFESIKNGIAQQFSVPAKSMRNVSPKILQRVSFVDNSFHLFWLPPTGVYARSLPQDPLLKRDNTAPVWDISTEAGNTATITIDRFLHFDVRLLNYGVLIV